MRAANLIHLQPVTMAVFLVDTLTKDKESGFTNSIEKIFFNIHNLGDDYEVNLNRELEAMTGEELNHIFSIGRYMCLLQISRDKSKGSMFFLDLDNDYDLALDVCSKFKSDTAESLQEFINLFMLEFTRLSETYDAEYNDVELMMPGSNNN